MFKDHFSDESSDYALYRPGYPPELFAWLAASAMRHERAWDCATGSGQAAVSLAEHFASVIATDGSEKQIASATQADNIDYRVALAEDCGIAPDSIDLVTVAQALHWFDIERFYNEVRRVCRDGAIVAAWTYSAADTDGPIGALIKQFHDKTVGPWWPPERELVSARYRTMSFPFAQIDAPPMTVQLEVSQQRLIGYVGTWSATKRCRRETGHDPVAGFASRLDRIWPSNTESLVLRMPLAARVGRVRH